MHAHFCACRPARPSCASLGVAYLCAPCRCLTLTQDDAEAMITASVCGGDQACITTSLEKLGHADAAEKASRVAAASGSDSSDGEGGGGRVWSWRWIWTAGSMWDTPRRYWRR